MTKVSIKSLIFGLVFILLIAAVAVLGVKLNDSVTTKTVGSFAFKVGGLDEDGVEIKSDNTIVTRDYISAGRVMRTAADRSMTRKVHWNVLSSKRRRYTLNPFPLRIDLKVLTARTITRRIVFIAYGLPCRTST